MIKYAITDREIERPSTKKAAAILVQLPILFQVEQLMSQVLLDFQNITIFTFSLSNLYQIILVCHNMSWYRSCCHGTVALSEWNDHFKASKLKFINSQIVYKWSPLRLPKGLFNDGVDDCIAGEDKQGIHIKMKLLRLGE